MIKISREYEGHREEASKSQNIGRFHMELPIYSLFSSNQERWKSTEKARSAKQYE